MSRIRLSSLLVLVLLPLSIKAQGVSTSTPGFSGNVTGCATTSNAIQKGNGNGGCVPATAGTDYATPAQVAAAQSAAQSYASNAANITSNVIAAAVLPMASTSTAGIIAQLPSNPMLFLRSDNTWATVSGGTATTDAGALTTGTLSPSRLGTGTVTNDKLANSGISINGTVVPLGGTIKTLAANLLQATLNGGAATGTVTSGSYCFPTNATSSTYPVVSVSGTTVTVTGNGSDVVTLLCVNSGSGSSTNPVATTLALASSSTSPTQGTAVTFTATISPSAAAGAITFKDGTATLGTGTLSSGTATYSTSALAVGSHSITANYPGNSSYNSSTSGAVTVAVAASSGSGGGTIVYSDSFPNSNIDTSKWNVSVGNFGVANNQLSPAGSYEKAVYQAGSPLNNNQYACAVYSAAGSGTIGYGVRADYNNNAYYMQISNGVLSVNTLVNGNFGNGLGATATPVVGHEYCITANNTAIAVTDNAGTATGKPSATVLSGVGGSDGQLTSGVPFLIGAGSSSTPSISNWNAGNL